MQTNKTQPDFPVLGAEEAVEAAKNALIFLRRCDLKGEEVQAFGEAWNMLNSLALGEAKLMPTGPVPREQPREMGMPPDAESRN